MIKNAVLGLLQFNLDSLAATQVMESVKEADQAELPWHSSCRPGSYHDDVAAVYAVVLVDAAAAGACGACLVGLLGPKKRQEGLGFGGSGVLWFRIE